MIYTNDNLKTCLGMLQNAYRVWRDDLAAQGFRTISLSLNRLIANMPPLYTAVMVKRDPPFEGRSFSSLSKAELDDKVKEMAKENPPLHPYIVSATGSGNGVTYAAAFRRMEKEPMLQANLSELVHRTEIAARRALGQIPIWIDSFGTDVDRRYCVIWADNPDRVGWNAEATCDKGSQRQQRFEAVASVGGRPALLAITPDDGYARLFVDTQLMGGWKSRPAKSKSAFQTEATSLATEGFFPTHIATGVIGGELMYSAIYTKTDDLVARTFRKRGPDPSGLSAANQTKVAAIDDWMDRYVRGHNLRGAALAIVENTRLVFARGYTFAEPGYADIDPTTLFRMASVSKTFCAFAAWKALLDSPAFSRESKMQTILKLKQRNGSPPADPDFADVRVRHLLESISGIDQWAFRGSMKKLRDSNDDPRPTQPASMETLLGMVAEMEMNQDPGETISYGKTDYILLGQVAAQLSKASSFDVALKALVLDPLKMTRTRSSRARVEDRAPDEAMHHLSDLSTNTSAVHNDRRLVASQYGEENYNLFDGAGGISTAMVDLARLCAMFSCRTNNPVLPPSVLKAMFEAAVASEATQGDHGHHGFDNPSGSDPTFTLDKGGSLPGVGSGFFGKTGKFFVTIARNGPVDPNSMGPTDWNTDLYKMAKDIDWAGKDMFPQFGMPTLKP